MGNVGMKVLGNDQDTNFLLKLDHSWFWVFFRMSPGEFETLLKMLAPLLTLSGNQDRGQSDKQPSSPW